MEMKCFLWPGLISCQPCKSPSNRKQNRFSKSANQKSIKIHTKTDFSKLWARPQINTELAKNADKPQCGPDLWRETCKPQYFAGFLPWTLSGLCTCLIEEHLHPVPYWGAWEFHQVVLQWPESLFYPTGKRKWRFSLLHSKLPEAQAGKGIHRNNVRLKLLQLPPFSGLLCGILKDPQTKLHQHILSIKWGRANI